ncbi:NAD(P)-binding protein [Ganoderma leucocontextum]|nr:NAD(P)-binding protein [Ganoderma leucocontextum]
MPLVSQKPLVLVVGATGTTGKNITDAVLASGNFKLVAIQRVGALIRPSSLSKPAVSELRARGVEIRTGDLNDSIESLRQSLEGVDILVSTIAVWAISQQRDIIRAAKAAAVERVVPCDFGTPGGKGVRAVYDEKLGIHDLVKELGLPHTFIDVGWWMQLYLPLPLASKAPQQAKDMTWTIYEDGTARNLVTSNENIGKYVARILADPRTVNQAVIVWEDEVSQEDAHALGERLSNDGNTLKAKRIVTTKQGLVAAASAAKEMLARDPSNDMMNLALSWNQVQISMNVLGENTLENATQRLGYLDARGLYPDIVPLPFEEYAKQFYAMEDPGIIFSQRE